MKVDQQKLEELITFAVSFGIAMDKMRENENSDRSVMAGLCLCLSLLGWDDVDCLVVSKRLQHSFELQGGFAQIFAQDEMDTNFASLIKTAVEILDQDLLDPSLKAKVKEILNK